MTTLQPWDAFMVYRPDKEGWQADSRHQRAIRAGLAPPIPDIAADYLTHIRLARTDLRLSSDVVLFGSSIHLLLLRRVITTGVSYQVESEGATAESNHFLEHMRFQSIDEWEEFVREQTNSS